MALPLLVVVSGPPGSGKATLAHTLAAFEPVVLPVPTIEVDTSVGLDPSLEAILNALARTEDPPS